MNINARNEWIKLEIVKKIIKWAISILLLFVIIVNFTLIIKSEINKDEIPDFLGYTPFIIVSGSMEPTIKTNEVIVTQKINKSDIKVGDVLSYKSSKDDIVITHRLIEIKIENGEEVYVMKGDNNLSVDDEKITYSQIQGKYINTIPFIGILVSYIKTPIGMAMVIGVVILIYIIFDIIQRMFEKDEVEKLHEQMKKNNLDKESN